MKTSGYVDFAALKERVGIVQVVEMLNLMPSLKAEGDRLLGCCPIHKGSDDREFIVTPAKGLWFCHGQCNAGGDMIELLARVRAVSAVQAAREIVRHFVIDAGGRGEQHEDAIIASPAGALRPKHEVVQALGIRPETAKAFGAGYCAERDCFVIPIYDDRGKYLSHVAVKAGEGDRYPDEFDGRLLLFNVHRVFPAECLYVTDAPLNVLRAHQDGIVNAIAIFGPYDPDRLFALANFVRRRQIGRVEFF
jgi:DNA primase